MDTYQQHLGFFRHFALVRRLYDDLQAAKDERKADKMRSLEREREQNGQVARLQDELLRKNNVRPVMEAPKIAKAAAQVGESEPRTPLDFINQRQADLDISSAALAKLHEEAEKVRYREEAEKILA